MSTRLDIRQRIRAELGDETVGAYVWSDGLLDSYINSAISRYSIDCPRQLATTVLTTAGQANYDLPEDCLQVTRVEYPVGNRLRRDTSGVRAPSGFVERTWDKYAGELTLSPAPGESGAEIVVKYLGRYAIPAVDDDQLDIPLQDEDLVVWLACEAALGWLNKQKDKRLDRRAGFLYPASYTARYQEALRARRRMRGVVGRRLV